MHRYAHSKRAGVYGLLVRSIAIASFLANQAIADIMAAQDASGQEITDVMTQFWNWYEGNDFRWYTYPGEQPCNDNSGEIVGFGDWIGQGYPGEPPNHPPIIISTNLWMLWLKQSNEVSTISQAVRVTAEHTNMVPGGLFGIPQFDVERDQTRFYYIDAGDMQGLYMILDYARIDEDTPTDRMLDQIGDLMRVHLLQNTIHFDVDKPGWTNNDVWVSDRWQDMFVYPTNDFFANNLGLYVDNPLDENPEYELNGVQYPGVAYNGHDLQNTDQHVMLNTANDDYRLTYIRGVKFLGERDHYAYAMKGVRDYIFQKYPSMARRGAFRMLRQNVEGENELIPFGYGGASPPKIIVVTRTYRQLAYIGLATPCNGDWGWFCFISGTYYDEEQNQYFTGDRWYTETEYVFEDVPDPDVCKTYNIGAKMKITVNQEGQNEPITFAPGTYDPVSGDYEKPLFTASDEPDVLPLFFKRSRRIQLERRRRSRGVGCNPTKRTNYEAFTLVQLKNT